MKGRAISTAFALTALAGSPAWAESPAVTVSDPIDRERAVQCLATAIAYEAAFEPIEGQQAVAEVVLNRVLHPSYPKSVCGVVFAGSERRTGCQFSFTCDGALRRRLAPAIVQATQRVAIAALDGLNPVRVAGATHYHADYVSPYWAPSLIRIAKIGAHIFYRNAGARDQGLGAAAFVPLGEPLIAQLGASSAPSEIVTNAAAGRGPDAARKTFAPWGLAASPVKAAAGSH